MKVLFCFGWLKFITCTGNTKLSPFKRLLPMMAAQTLNSLAVSVFLYILGLTLSEDVVVEIQRSILREGFHRDIKTVVSIQPSDIVLQPEGTCGILLIETLPSSLYIDTFQLDAVAEFGGPQVLADRHVDIEAPEYLSKPHELYVYAALPIRDGRLSSPVKVTIPLLVHVRYHRPSPDPKVSHVAVIMHHPRVLLNCSRKNSRSTLVPCDAQNTSLCSWAEVVYKSDTNFLELQVPVGHEEDTRIVIYGTIVVTVMGCSFLLYVIAFYSHWKVKVK